MEQGRTPGDAPLRFPFKVGSAAGKNFLPAISFFGICLSWRRLPAQGHVLPRAGHIQWLSKDMSSGPDTVHSNRQLLFQDYWWVAQGLVTVQVLPLPTLFLSPPTRIGHSKHLVLQAPSQCLFLDNLAHSWQKPPELLNRGVPWSEWC